MIISKQRKKKALDKSNIHWSPPQKKKILSKLGKEGNFLSLIQGIYKPHS